MDQRFSLDAAALRKSFNKASSSFDAAAVLHREVRERALARLLPIRAQPQSILDLGAGTCQGSTWLSANFPNAQIIAIDSALQMLVQSDRQRTFWQRLLGRSVARVCGDATALPLRDATIDWVFSSLMLPWCTSLENVLAEVRRVLKPNGVFSFTTLGPDTLHELRQAWQKVDGAEHVHLFIDMHDLGDALVRAGFADPVLDIERFTLTYSDMASLAKDLKATGSGNALTGRSRGLMGRGKFAKVDQAYEALRRDDKLPATFEVVYGQAWQSIGKSKTQANGEVKVSLDSLRGRRR